MDKLWTYKRDWCKRIIRLPFLVGPIIIGQLRSLNLSAMCLISILIVVVIFRSSENPEQSSRKCYTRNAIYSKVTIENVKMLEYVEESSRKPMRDKTIFFHVTSCSSSGLVSLTSREVCAIESAARAHPKHDVFVMFASPVGLDPNDDGNLAGMLCQSNVYFRNVDLWAYARNSPVADLIHNEYNSSVVFATGNLEEKIAAYLRFLSLYKYGGICLELDVIVRKSMASLGRNFVGLDYHNNVLDSVLSLSQSGEGHFIAKILLSEFFDNFLESEHPGQDTLIRVLTTLHPNKVKMLNYTIFYPIVQSDWMMLFDATYRKYAEKEISEAYTVRFWKSQSSYLRLQFKRHADGTLDTKKLPSFVNLANEYCFDIFEENPFSF